MIMMIMMVVCVTAMIMMTMIMLMMVGVDDHDALIPLLHAIGSGSLMCVYAILFSSP
jgi:hypothetical protein